MNWGRAMPQEEYIPVGANLDTWSDEPWANGVQLDRMGDMERLCVETSNSGYEIVIIDGPSGAILVRGGQCCPEIAPARLAGASLGGSFCEIRWIYTSFP